MVVLHQNASKECSVCNFATVVGGVYVGAVRPQPAHKLLSARRRCGKNREGIETRTCGAFYVGKRKQGGALHTEGVWGAHDEGTAGRAMARWIDAVLEEAEDCRAIVGSPL